MVDALFVVHLTVACTLCLHQVTITRLSSTACTGKVRRLCHSRAAQRGNPHTSASIPTHTSVHTRMHVFVLAVLACRIPQRASVPSNVALCMILPLCFLLSPFLARSLAPLPLFLFELRCVYLQTELGSLRHFCSCSAEEILPWWWKTTYRRGKCCVQHSRHRTVNSPAVTLAWWVLATE